MRETGKLACDACGGASLTGNVGLLQSFPTPLFSKTRQGLSHGAIPLAPHWRVLGKCSIPGLVYFLLGDSASLSRPGWPWAYCSESRS